MATRGLLHQPSVRTPPSTYLHRKVSRFLFLRKCSSSSRGVQAFRCSFSTASTAMSAKFLKVEDQAVQSRDSPQAMLEYSHTEAEEYVNRQPPGPMVEVDPVTIFRRIIAERRASFVMARAKQPAADGAIFRQSTGTQPFFIGSRWSDKPRIGIALAIVLIVLAAIALFLKSRPRSAKKTERTSIEEVRMDGFTGNDKHKLVDDNIQASDSILTAMTIGAASIGRSKGHPGISPDTVNDTNGNVVDTQSLNTGKPAAFEDVRTDGHGMRPFGHFSYNPSSMEPLGFFKAQDIGVDVTEGPWYSRAAENPDFSEAAVSNEITAYKMANEISKNNVIYKNQPVNNFVDGEFSGELISASVVTKEALSRDDSSQIKSFQIKQPEDDVVLGKTSAISEKLEQMMKQESIPFEETMSVVGENNNSEQGQLPEQHTTMTEINTNICDEHPGVADYERGEEWDAAIQPSTPLKVGKVAIAPTVANDDVDGEHENAPSLDTRVAKAASFEPMAAGSQICNQQMAGSNQTSHQNSVVAAHASRPDMATNPFKEDLREDNKRALKEAVPALAIGVGTIGTLLGVGGGLQVVGFAAVASFLSQDVFWAQSRAKLWQELKEITNRAKLLDFLVRRNILRTHEEDASL